MQLSGSPRLAYRLSRFAAFGALVYLGAWFTVLQPLLETRVEFYGPDLDGLLRALQFGAVIQIAGALIGLWNAKLSLFSGRHWAGKLGNLLLAAALIGIVWIGWTGSLMSFSLEY